MKILRFLLLFLIIYFVSTSCQENEKHTIHEKIKEDTNSILDSLITIRRDLHQHPELAGKEKRTSQIIANYLTDLGLEVKTGIAGYGVIGILEGNPTGKKVAWRADMDAISSDFKDPVSFKSLYEGIQHGCGHDVHVAIGLGIAKVLSMNKESVDGTVYFIFQPEEESFKGAQNMVNSDFFTLLELDEIYALHITALPVGQITTKPNEVFAYQKRIQLNFDKGITEENISELYSKIRNSISRVGEGTLPWKTELAFDPSLGITSPETIFNDYLFVEENFILDSTETEYQLKSFLYETRNSNLNKLLPQIENVIENSELSENYKEGFYIQENPTVLNDEALTTAAIKTLDSVYNTTAVAKSYGQIPYFNDDFYYFQQKIPGVYFLLGGSNESKGITAMNHAPNFQVDEESIKIGVQVFSFLLIERSKNKK
ncbi:M20 metallopeptidase family protein [Nonlabens dokdonensis]|jgi:metal-dependent amidase/aminoacylase/carboxypeptidase family protein|uniref:Amidohydrolase n=2 Tax=Nonlabens dokdonensis TaxID=328515 RepID=L7WCB9_NONDD|nr:M20/M25/M40 family metallo-hydrolase [Nonlabens dokdonensis]AGC77739.1 amidohydrolase [Nonlabens dokdonensis DSW-6]